ncbi:MAG TPA: hypothetical protein DF383_12255, partial [Deltaproteobacteria bacterium]|nr:hypothetical protein [Deltaproteobacteria bacterium]
MLEGQILDDIRLVESKEHSGSRGALLAQRIQAAREIAKGLSLDDLNFLYALDKFAVQNVEDIEAVHARSEGKGI